MQSKQKVCSQGKTFGSTKSLRHKVQHKKLLLAFRDLVRMIFFSTSKDVFSSEKIGIDHQLVHLLSNSEIILEYLANSGIIPE
jgi:hypothetical protein